jgi:hypothetical protein
MLLLSMLLILLLILSTLLLLYRWLLTHMHDCYHCYDQCCYYCCYTLQAKRLLACAAQGFEHSHGADLGRLRALKGENCAEYALYARLHLLQGIVAYLSGIAIVMLTSRDESLAFSSHRCPPAGTPCIRSIMCEITLLQQKAVVYCVSVTCNAGVVIKHAW